MPKRDIADRHALGIDRQQRHLALEAGAGLAEVDARNQAIDLLDLRQRAADQRLGHAGGDALAHVTGRDIGADLHHHRFLARLALLQRDGELGGAGIDRGAAGGADQQRHGVGTCREVAQVGAYRDVLGAEQLQDRLAGAHVDRDGAAQAGAVGHDHGVVFIELDGDVVEDHRAEWVGLEGGDDPHEKGQAHRGHEPHPVFGELLHGAPSRPPWGVLRRCKRADHWRKR
ncbi:MAG: hypothetical protein MUC99_06350 [Anaerolineae bacterium]|nr:hypothetical protein [Anaerolineae bacterium]